MSIFVLLQHLGSSKANRIEQFRLEDLQEITLGRDANSMIAFDPQRDDTVSRQHAVIKVRKGDPPTFTITDLGSSNGTRVNGNVITGETELLVGDTVELGKDGPKFSFDLQPRPASLVGRTRVMDGHEAGATRVLREGDATHQTFAATRPTAESPKVPIGRETVEHLLSAQRQATDDLLQAQRHSTSRIWQYIAAGILVVICAGGAGLYFIKHRTAAELAAAKLDIQAGIASNIASVSESSANIGKQVAGATVFIHVLWRAYDPETGKPLFQRVISRGGDKRPSFVELADHTVVPWLITDDEGTTNAPIGEVGYATGFIIDREGYILTNKHVVAGWMRSYDLVRTSKTVDLYQVQSAMGKEQIPTQVSSGDARISDLNQGWEPSRGGWVFKTTQPVVAGIKRKFFQGKDDTLDIRFPGVFAASVGRFVRASPKADVALIKVDTQAPLTPVTLADEADEADVRVGQRVIVLGYPGFSKPSVAVVRTMEIGQNLLSRNEMYQPTVTDGIISHLGATGNWKESENGPPTLSVVSDDKDSYQLTVPTGYGNDGGPVLNTSGKVIGIFLSNRPGLETVSFAAPIKHARQLISNQ